MRAARRRLKSLKIRSTVSFGGSGAGAAGAGASIGTPVAWPFRASGLVAASLRATAAEDQWTRPCPGRGEAGVVVGNENDAKALPLSLSY